MTSHIGSALREQRTNILVSQFMGEADALRLVLDGASVDDSNPELLDDRFVDGIALED
jgi:hypothetical protein